MVYVKHIYGQLWWMVSPYASISRLIETFSFRFCVFYCILLSLWADSFNIFGRARFSFYSYCSRPFTGYRLVTARIASIWIVLYWVDLQFIDSILNSIYTKKMLFVYYYVNEKLYLYSLEVSRILRILSYLTAGEKIDKYSAIIKIVYIFNDPILE